MGYTHYWEIKQNLTASEWMKIQQKARALIKKARAKGICVAGGAGEGSPEVSSKEIWLNGCAKKKWKHKYAYPGADQAHETFSFKPKKREFDFCKTAEKPYDALVVSILNEARKIAPKKIRVSSDGGDEAIKTVLKGLGLLPAKKRRRR